MIPPLHSPIMDINPSNLETSKNMIIWGTNFDQNAAEPKSFRCTFCKRGFSNAQALGGHMNIHRKDRAKLREFSSENLLSLDISKSLEDDESPPPESSDSKIPAQDLDHVEEEPVRRMEEAAVEGGEEGGGGGGRFDKHVEGIKVELVNHGELDLELRLGPQPPHAKSKGDIVEQKE